MGGLDLSWFSLLWAVVGIVPQLMTVIARDPCSRVAAPSGLADGATAVAGAADTGGGQVRSCWRGPEGGWRSKTARELGTGPSSLRGTLASTRL